MKSAGIASISLKLLLFRTFLLPLFLLFTIQLKAANVYSGGTGTYNVITWYTNSARTIVFGGVPGAAETINIGNGHIVTIPSGTTVTFAGIVVHDLGASGSLVLGDIVNTAIALTINGNITVNASGSITVGGNGGATHAVSISGNIVNNNSINLINATADVANVTFTGNVNQSLSGTGNTFTFNRLTLNTTLSSNLNVNINIRINSVLTFNANGFLVVDVNSNITLGPVATIAGNNASRYIQLDSTTVTNSQLIKVNNNTTATWQIVYPIGTNAGGYTPLDLSAAGGASLTTAPTLNATLAVKAIYNPSAQGQMRRTFRMVVAGNAAATVFNSADFYYNSGTDVSQGDVLANYSTLWYLDLSTATWATVTGTAPGAGFFTAPGANSTLGNGTYFFTIGTSTAYPETWHTYQDGNWNDPNVWTLDPSGTTFVNPLTQSPSEGDQVDILNGSTVTIPAGVNNLVLSTTTIEGGGELDITTTTGHNFGTVSGSGLLRIKGVSLPTGNYSSFVAATGGTIEYYDIGGTLPAAQTTYNNLLLTNSTGSSIVFVTVNNLTFNNNLAINQTSGAGTVTWQVNDASNVQRTITINGDLSVSSSGQIRAGTGNTASAAQHNLTLSGNLINNGSIKFFDATDPVLSDANYTSGAVYTSALRGNAIDVTFSGLTNKTVTCNNQTDFYGLILNKGTGQQALLTVNSSGASNFRFFGPANLGSNTGAAPNEISNDALSLVNGTLQLTGTITIPILAVNGGTANDYFSIPQNAGLWVNSSNVSITVTNNSGANDDQRIMLDGLLRVSSGSMFFGRSKGLGSGAAGLFLLEGGTVTTWQFRARAGGTGIFVYSQTGGVFNVGTTGYNSTPATSGIDGGSDARFDLSSATSSFQMTGGTLNIGTPTAVGGNGINIASSSANYYVTGGTVNVYIPTSGNTFTIGSTVPIYNMIIYREGTVAALTAQASLSLTILNNLTLITGNTPTLNCNNNNLTVGGNIDIQANTTLTPGANTIIINGSGAQSWSQSGTITSLNNIVVNKSAGVLTLGGSGTFPNIVSLTLTSGSMNDGGKTLTVTATLNNSATHTGTGVIVHSAAGVSAIGGTGGTFGNLTINTNATVSTSGNQSVTGTLRLLGANSTMSIGSNGLTVLGNIYSDATTLVAFTNTKRIQTNGLRNDNGLSRQATSGADLLFPVGTSVILYTPATINATAGIPGIITVRPVNSAHTNVTTAAQSVRFFWRVTSTGFSGITAVVHKSYTYSNATRDAASVNYRPARYDGGNFTWAYGPVYDATAVPGTTTIPNFNTGAGWTGIGSSQLDGEYTAGNLAAFGAVTVYYSRAAGSWGTAATWSLTSVGGPANAPGAPCPTCPVVIGDGGANNHSITIDANARTCGSLFVASGSTLDCGAFTNLNYGVNTSGTGTVRIGSVNFPAGDFINFLGPTGGTIEWYGSGFTIPATGPAPQNIALNTYYNLTVSPTAALTITMPATDLTIYNNFTVSGGAAGNVFTNVGGTRTITVNGTLGISSGILSIRNIVATNFIINGNTTIASGSAFQLQGGGAITHTFSTQGNITNNGTMTFLNGGERINITFTGSSNTSLTGTDGTSTTTLNLLSINKGSSQTPVFTIDIPGTLTTLSNNWLTLLNGTINFNKPTGTFTLTNTVTNPYSIPSSARLKVQSGIVNISNIANSASDLLLSGTLEVAGGTINIGTSGFNSNNDIEYASAGLPAIIVSNGTLYVNGAIRRSTSTLSGALVYNQSNGVVTAVGRNCNVAPNNTRGVFEIENNIGSSFTLSGGTLTVSRPTGGSNFEDLFLNPVSSSVSTTSTIQIGDNTLGAQTLDINVTPALGSLTILGAAGNAQTVNMTSSPLSTSGTLSINTASTLNTNSLDVTIGGNLVINGTYNGTIGTGNTTTFNGIVAQTASLSATSTFQDMSVNKPSGTVTLSGTSPTITDLNILSGILDVGSLNLSVIGNIINNSSQVNSTGGSISLAGGAGITSQLITCSGGSFGNLTLTGAAASKNVTLTGNMTINGTLNFATTNRYLTIGSYQLTFGAASSVASAGATAFIRTNGVSSDLGVVKIWPVGTNSFTYPLGTLFNYTPATYTLTVNASGSGNLTVIPVNSRHPTYNIASSEQILNYYWIVTRDNNLNITTTGSHVYSYPSALMGGTGGALVAGLLNLSNPTGWIRSGHGGTATATTMTFTNLLSTNMPPNNTIFNYTVGTINTLPNPISSVYSRLLDANVSNPGIGGNWNNANSWTLASDGLGPALGAAPFGVPVVILNGARINLNVNGRIAFNTQITGLLVVGTTTAHNLGNLSGTGIMKTQINTLPAGNYVSFVASSGGTIEYVAPMTMNNRSTYNNLNFSGAGSVTMTNTDLILNGTLNITVVGITLNNSVNNRNITLQGNWLNSGAFTAGTGKVTFNGTAAQSVTGTNNFNSITISNTGGDITLAGTGATSINGILTLTNGKIITSATHPLTLGSSETISGGSSSSYISGSVIKVLTAGGTSLLPIGSISANRYRPVTIGNVSATDTWTAQYFGYSASTDGYATNNFNSANLGTISNFEYWVISRAGATSADVTISYNTGSYAPPNIGTVANLRVARWNSGWDVPPGGGSFSQTGDSISGTITVTNVTAFSPITAASTDINSSLPITLLKFSGERIYSGVLLKWTTIRELNNDRFEIERSTTGTDFMKVASVPGAGTSDGIRDYLYGDEQVSPFISYYYRLRQVDFDGQFMYSLVIIIKPDENQDSHSRWIIYPNPVRSESVTLTTIDPSFDLNSQLDFMIISPNGQTILQSEGTLGEFNEHFGTFIYQKPGGLYFIIILDGVKRETLRLIRN